MGSSWFRSAFNRKRTAEEQEHERVQHMIALLDTVVRAERRASRLTLSTAVIIGLMAVVALGPGRTLPGVFVPFGIGAVATVVWSWMSSRRSGQAQARLRDMLLGRN